MSTLKKAEFLVPTTRSLAVQTLGARLLECTEKDATYTMAFNQFPVTLSYNLHGRSYAHDVFPHWMPRAV